MGVEGTTRLLAFLKSRLAAIESDIGGLLSVWFQTSHRIRTGLLENDVCWVNQLDLDEDAKHYPRLRSNSHASDWSGTPPMHEFKKANDDGPSVGIQYRKIGTVRSRDPDRNKSEETRSTHPQSIETSIQRLTTVIYDLTLGGSSFEKQSVMNDLEVCVGGLVDMWFQTNSRVRTELDTLVRSNHSGASTNSNSKSNTDPHQSIRGPPVQNPFNTTTL